MRQSAGEPGTTGAGVGAAAQRCGRGWHRADAWSTRTWARANGAEAGDRSAVSLSHIGHGTRLLGDIHAEEACARVGQGGPPRFAMMVRHQAALALGKLTRVTSGVNLPPSEVIMSRYQRHYEDQSLQCTMLLSRSRVCRIRMSDCWGNGREHVASI